MTQPHGPSPYSQQGSDEQFWRRPDGTGGQPPGSPAAINPAAIGAAVIDSAAINPAVIGPAGRDATPTGSATAVSASYAGPPRGAPAAPGWRPPTLIQVPPAHALPAQDDGVLDEQERAARTVTLGVGMLTGAIALLVLIVLCGRVVF